MTDREMEILTDASLSTDARIVALAILHKGEGFHELRREEAQDLLSNEAGRDRAQRAIGQLERRGIVERRIGGRGHADAFRIKVPAATVAKSDSGRQPRHLSLTVVGEGDEVVPPVVPHAERRLTERAVKAMERAGDKLSGCRGALRDYLTDRVPEDRQYAYVQSVVGWIDGLGRAFTQHDGTQAEPARRPGILADALNDLAGSDETKLSRPVGDVANLRTKIDVLLRSEGPRPPRKPRGTKTGATGPQQFEYTPTTEFKGFTR